MTPDHATPHPAPDAPPVVRVRVGGKPLFPRDELRPGLGVAASVPFSINLDDGDGGPTTLRGEVTFDAVGLAAVAEEVFLRVLAALRAAAPEAEKE
jgi:hypothetical protein